MQFGPEKELEIFKQLATVSTYKVGIAFGFDKVYKDFNKVRNNPEKYGVSQEVIELVQQGMATRKANVVGETPTMAEKSDMVGDIKALVTGIRDKTFKLIDKKLDRVSNSKKRLDAISFKDLGIIAGISFDKSQILRGEATENIAVMAQIDGNISAAEALALALKMRETSIDQNTDR